MISDAFQTVSKHADMAAVDGNFDQTRPDFE